MSAQLNLCGICGKFAVEKPKTVEALMKELDLLPSRIGLLVNGRTVDPAYLLNPNDKLVILPHIEGGTRHTKAYYDRAKKCLEVFYKRIFDKISHSRELTHLKYNQVKVKSTSYFAKQWNIGSSTISGYFKKSIHNRYGNDKAQKILKKLYSLSKSKGKYPNSFKNVVKFQRNIISQLPENPFDLLKDADILNSWNSYSEKYDLGITTIKDALLEIMYFKYGKVLGRYSVRTLENIINTLSELSFVEAQFTSDTLSYNFERIIISIHSDIKKGLYASKKAFEVKFIEKYLDGFKGDRQKTIQHLSDIKRLIKFINDIKKDVASGKVQLTLKVLAEMDMKASSITIGRAYARLQSISATLNSLYPFFEKITIRRNDWNFIRDTESAAIYLRDVILQDSGFLWALENFGETFDGVIAPQKTWLKRYDQFATSEYSNPKGFYNRLEYLNLKWHFVCKEAGLIPRQSYSSTKTSEFLLDSDFKDILEAELKQNIFKLAVYLSETLYYKGELPQKILPSINFPLSPSIERVSSVNSMLAYIATNAKMEEIKNIIVDEYSRDYSNYEVLRGKDGEWTDKLSRDKKDLTFINQLIYYAKNVHYKNSDILGHGSAAHAVVLPKIVKNVEEAISCEVPLILKDLYGHLDLLIVKDGVVYAADYKPDLKYESGTAPHTSFINSMPQVLAYALILKQMFNLREVRCITFNKEGAWYYEPESTLEELTKFVRMNREVPYLPLDPYF
ncbi:MAG: hypothetical protein GF383_13310 [Candidatus Lokiarchaeota archaeon]|nr:hypothetical protein [Candidatus Lokiarchaeota archaeon]MBD3342162.1 hypothetical protein [Candidatus Lokiarchaeota archaeon]